MAIFRYKARTMDGVDESGTMEAPDRSRLMYQLHRDGLFVYEIKEDRALVRNTWRLRLSPKRLIAFCNQMSAMLKAGIPLARALDICRNSAADKPTREILGEVSERVQKGQSLSQAMLEMGDIFPVFLIYMIETGETSGTLDLIMERMTTHYEQEVQLRGKIQTALIYPSILAVVAVAAAIFMLTFVLPQFVYMFEDMELPAVTRFLMYLSVILSGSWYYIIIGLAVCAGLLCWLMTKDFFRQVIHRWMLMLPLAGNLVKTIYTSRFAATFSILYGSGVGVLRCLDICGRVLGNQYIRIQLEKASIELRAGKMLSESLKDTDVFQRMFISMVMVGEESGSLEQILEDTGAFFEKEANTALTQLVALLEPMMIIIMGGMIGVIVLAIMLPIFQMYGHMM